MATADASSLRAKRRVSWVRLRHSPLAIRRDKSDNTLLPVDASHRSSCPTVRAKGSPDCGLEAMSIRSTKSHLFAVSPVHSIESTANVTQTLESASSVDTRSRKIHSSCVADLKARAKRCIRRSPLCQLLDHSTGDHSSGF